MIVRLFLGAGLFVLGYYMGREVGRAEPVREALRAAREGEGTGPAETREEGTGTGGGSGTAGEAPG